MILSFKDDEKSCLHLKMRQVRRGQIQSNVDATTSIYMYSRCVHIFHFHVEIESRVFREKEWGREWERECRQTQYVNFCVCVGYIRSNLFFLLKIFSFSLLICCCDCHFLFSSDARLYFLSMQLRISLFFLAITDVFLWALNRLRLNSLLSTSCQPLNDGFFQFTPI